MNNQDDPIDGLSALINEALREPPRHFLSADFTEKLLTKVNRRNAWSELIREFAAKVGIIAGTLVILAVCLIFPMKDSLDSFTPVFKDYWHLMAGVALILLFTFFTDQVLLKFYSRHRRL